MKPRKVTTLNQLVKLRAQRRAIIVPGHGAYNAPKPAAWMLNLSGDHLHHLMCLGMYVYDRRAT